MLLYITMVILLPYSIKCHIPLYEYIPIYLSILLLVQIWVVSSLELLGKAAVSISVSVF